MIVSECNHNWVSPHGRLEYCNKCDSTYVETLEAEIATLTSELAELKERATDKTWALSLSEIAVEHDALREAAREYSYNEHAQDCKITRYTRPVCSCGYTELAALLPPTKESGE